MKPSSNVHFHSTSIFAAIRLVVSVLRFAITYAGQLAARALLRACFTALASLLRLCLGSDNVLANACAAVAKGTIPHRGFRSALWVAWSRTLVQAGYRPARLFLDLVALCTTMRPVSRVELSTVDVPATQHTQQAPPTVKGTWVRPKRATMLPRSLSQGSKEADGNCDEVVVLYMHGGGFRIGNALANTALFELLLHMWETMWAEDPVSPHGKAASSTQTHSTCKPALVKTKSAQGSARVRFADVEAADQQPLLNSGRMPRPASTGILQPASVVHSCSQQSLALLTAASDMPQHPPLAWFSLDYDLAPEHKWPTQIQQCLAAYTWLVARGYTKIFLAGDSAGGNLALTTALCLRDSYAELPQPLGVLAFSPWTDLTTDPSTYSEGDADILSWNPARHAEVVRAYLGVCAAQLVLHPHVSPQMADLQGLPPLWICAGDVELLEPDIGVFVRKARAAGCDVAYVKGRGMYHSYATLYPLMGDPEGLVALRSCISFLAHHVGGV